MDSEFAVKRPNNTVIEMASVNALKDAINRTMVAVPAIPDTDDKVPSWDGEIRLYDSPSNFRKENLVGRIPTQVKGTWVKRFSGKRASYRVQTSDLRNYQKDGGVLFFLIQSKDFDNYKIYYAALLPFDLGSLLNDAGDQETIQIWLESMAYKYKDGTIQILSDFLENKKRQGSLLSGVFSLRDLRQSAIQVEQLEFFLPANGSSEDKLLDGVFKQPRYIYAKPVGIDVPFAVDKIQIEKIIEARPLSIEANGELLFDQVKMVVKRDKSKVYQLGDDVSITLREKAITFHFDMKGSLSEQIRALKLLSALMEGKTVKVGGDCVSSSNAYCLKEHTLEEVRQRLATLLSIQETLTCLHVKKDIPFGSLTNNETSQLMVLKAGILDGVPIPLNTNGQAGYGMLTIANITVMLAWKADANSDKYFISDFFSQDNLRIVPEGECFQNGTLISPYMMLSAKQFEMIDNIDLQSIVPSIKKYSYTDIFGDKMVLFTLELLKVFDDVHDEGILDVILQMLTLWHENERSNEEVYQIDRLQTEKRRRDLTKEEKQYLMTLKEPGVSLQFRLAASILLESFQEAQMIYDEMPEDEREEFDTYPIKNLWWGN